MKVFGSVISLLLITFVGAAQTTLNGSVHDDSGAVVAGAFVHATRVRDLVRDTYGHLISEGQYTSVRAQVAADGTFSLTSLPSGRYFVCAYGSSSGYISNCEWKSSVAATVVGTTTPSNIALTLSKGTVVTITVSDPQGLINPGPVTRLGTPPKHHFYPGVMSAQGYYSAARYSGDNGTSHLYVVTVPKSTTTALFVDTDLTTTTTTGQGIPPRVPSSVAIIGGPDAVTINLNVQ